jgi:uncharacterized protein (TIGR02453 family)
MANHHAFDGFPGESIEFLEALKKNNNKFWFDKHKDDYENYILIPSRNFVSAMGGHLRKIAPRVVADPRINKSLFKIYRDTRFSKDKTPFKTHVGIWFWEGAGKRMECSGFYFHIEPPDLTTGVGVYKFTDEQLPKYRKAVVSRKHGSALVKALGQVQKTGPYRLGGKHYKKAPRGYDPLHENAEYLLYNSIYIYHRSKIPKAFYSVELLDYCFKRYKDMSPVHRWLRDIL